jgi:hypothetical protein
MFVETPLYRHKVNKLAALLPFQLPLHQAAWGHTAIERPKISPWLAFL